MLTNDNRLWVCGENTLGQLGLGYYNNNRKTFTLVTALPEAMQQVFRLNHTLKQLIKLGTTLTPTPSTQSNRLPSQHQPDEPEDNPP